MSKIRNFLMNQNMVQFMYNSVYWGQHLFVVVWYTMHNYDLIIIEKKMWCWCTKAVCHPVINSFGTFPNELWWIFYMPMGYQDTTMSCFHHLHITVMPTGILCLVIVLICIACTPSPLCAVDVFCEIQEAINVCFIHIVIRIYSCQTCQWKSIQDIKNPD